MRHNALTDARGLCAPSQVLEGEPLRGLLARVTVPEGVRTWVETGDAGGLGAGDAAAGAVARKGNGNGGEVGGPAGGLAGRLGRALLERK